MRTTQYGFLLGMKMEKKSLLEKFTNCLQLLKQVHFLDQLKSLITPFFNLFSFSLYHTSAS